MRSIHSTGWGIDVVLGSGQSRVLEVLESIAAREPRRKWHDAPPMREFGGAPSRVHQHLHRLAALGVIAIETRLGRYGGVRFTFRGRRWKWDAPARRAITLARMKIVDLRAALPSMFHPPIRTPSKKNEPRTGTLPGPTFGELMAQAGFVPA
jgi:hypothetical protein